MHSEIFFFLSSIHFYLKKYFYKSGELTPSFRALWSGELCIDWLFPVLWAMGLRNGRYPRSICNWGVHGPLGGVHVSECRIEAGTLAGSMAVVSIGALMVCVVILGASDGRVRRAIVLEIEGTVADLLR